MWTKKFALHNPPPGAGTALVSGPKPGTSSPSGVKPLPPSFDDHHEARESELCPLAEKLMVREGEGFTPDELLAFFEAITPLVEYVEKSGQRLKGQERLSVNGPAAINQRIHVMTHMIYPWMIGGSRTHVKLGEELGVCRSMIMRHVKDFNVAFGIFGSTQKSVSKHGDIGGDCGTYVEAAYRGHETRRHRKAEREAAANTNDEL